MKKILFLLLTGVFMTCLAACASNGLSASGTDDLPAMENSVQGVIDNDLLSEPDPSVSEDNEPSSDKDFNLSMEDETSDEESEDETIMQQNTFYVIIGGETFSATFADNSGAQALKELLAGGDVTIQMSDYGGFEKVGSLGQSLPTEDSQTTTQAGDIVLYQGNQIVIFYGSNSWSYTRLGKIDDLTGWQEALSGGDIAVIFSLEGE